MKPFMLVALCVFGFAICTPTVALGNETSPEQALAATLAKCYAEYQANITKANTALNEALGAIERQYLAEQQHALAAHNRRALIAAYAKKIEASDDARADWSDAVTAFAERLARERAEAYRAYQHFHSYHNHNRTND